MLSRPTRLGVEAFGRFSPHDDQAADRGTVRRADASGGHAVPVIYLTTRRLRLRQFTTDDVDALVELNSDPDVMRFLTGGKPISREEIEGEVLPSYLRAHECSADFGVWSAIENETGDFIGWFALTPPDGVDSVGRDSVESGADGQAGESDESDERGAPAQGTVADLGYRLRKSAWGKGYATEGARALIRKAFTDLGIDRVTAQTMAVNTGSRRVMEKAGLRHVRTWHQEWPDPIEGTEQGEVEYAIDRAASPTTRLMPARPSCW